MQLRDIEIVEDRTEQSRCDEGFLHIRRLRLRNVYEGGSRSQVYPCDVVSRPGSDAVVAVLYELDGERHIRVLLRDGLRAPVYLRRFKRFVQRDSRPYDSLAELVAGLIEEADGDGSEGLRRCAARETLEEAGLAVASDCFEPLGGECFASPGTSDEKLFYCAAPAPVAQACESPGDGTVMEENARLVAVPLDEAIEACRSGSIPDLKTEVGLFRLADYLGYLPQLGCFVDELPEPLRGRHRRLGVAPRGRSEAEPRL
jgi:8-oxo-dGTP pyrophosphatase MutT (NUDIX family)